MTEGRAFVASMVLFVFGVAFSAGATSSIIYRRSLDYWAGVPPIRQTGVIAGYDDSGDRAFDAVSLDDGVTWYEIVRTSKTAELKPVDPKLNTMLRFKAR